MSTINIADLQASGSDLFADNESYLNELDDSSLLITQVQGGTGISCATFSVATVITAISVATRIIKEIMEPECPPPPPCAE
jgi:hypothetical protein